MSGFYAFFLGTIENFRNLIGVKHLTNSMSGVGAPLFFMPVVAATIAWQTLSAASISSFPNIRNKNGVYRLFG